MKIARIWGHPAGSRGSRLLFGATCVLALAAIVAGCGGGGGAVILPATAAPVDVQGLSTSSAVPGEIIRVDTSALEAAALDSYRVAFGQYEVKPMRVHAGAGSSSGDPSYLTVMVPPAGSSQYAVSVRVPGADGGASLPIFIRAPEFLPAWEAEETIYELLDNVDSLFDLAELDLMASAGSTGLSPATQMDVNAGFTRCAALLDGVRYEIPSLRTEEVITAAQLLVGSGVTTDVASAYELMSQHSGAEAIRLAASTRLQAVEGNSADAAFFRDMTRLDVISAVLTDVSLVITAVKYSSIVITIATAGASAPLTGAAWGVLSVVQLAIDEVDHVIDGLVRTDLKLVRIEVTPDEGTLLGPGETATVRILGTFGTQSSWSKELVEGSVDLLLSLIPGGDAAGGSAAQVLKATRTEATNEIAGILASANLSLADYVFDLDFASLGWAEDVPLDPAYYYLAPGLRMLTGFACLAPRIPFAEVIQKVVFKLLGAQDTFLTNLPVTVDDPGIATYDLTTGKLTAHRVGSTTIRVRPYRFQEVFSFIWTLEGWTYLEEGARVDYEGNAGNRVEENVPLRITVTSQYDPVTSNLEEAPISGVVPDVFSTDGGRFEISVSPVDPNGDLIHQGMTAENFTFSKIEVRRSYDLGNVVTTGIASADSLEIVLPTDPGAGVSVAILLDSSGSMASNDPGRDRVTAAKSFVDRLRVDDQAAVLDFGAGSTSGFGDTRLLQGFTSNKTLLYDAIDKVTASGSTPLYESLYEVLGYVDGPAVGNPAIVVLTDGEANSSNLFNSVVSRAQSLNVPLFCVGLGTSIDFTELQDLSSLTGGAFASVASSADLEDLFDALGVAVSAGRIIVHASGAFMPPLTDAGLYRVSGVMSTRVSGLSLPTPFEFMVEIE